jgi:hypothetical protein
VKTTPQLLGELGAAQVSGLAPKQDDHIHAGPHPRPQKLDLSVEPATGPIADNRPFGYFAAYYHRYPGTRGVVVGVVFDGKGRHMDGISVLEYPGEIFLSAEPVGLLQHIKTWADHPVKALMAEALPPLLPAAFEDIPPRLAAHALEEPMLPGPLPFLWLIGPFGHSWNSLC